MFKSVDQTKTSYLVITLVASVVLSAFVAGQAPAGPSNDGEQISDVELQARVAERLSRDPEVLAAGIEVDARQGEIWLSGEVKSFDVFQRAGDAARAVDGATRVHNDLKVRPPQLVWRTDDQRIVDAVKSKIESYSIGPSVEVESRGGVVTLTGRVRSTVAKRTAGVLAHSTASVRTVDNQLQIIGS